ncbi:hypothetical protein SAMN05421847_0393 [Halpernia humi]|uniref:Uncharacterized protein n=1 Tax=Halpernia humi TaxID=493375 RepID=A0A1H5T7T5_9FLAO|nr:hypothetical protein [Halpernia humi]SEF58875.1 hypothetical protein SAMN05421847_0393 [Halpernia humi]
MKSKFTIKAFLPIILLFPFVYLIFLLLPIVLKENTGYDDKIFVILFPIFLIFIVVILFYGEIRTKFIIVEINKYEIKVKKFLGLFTKSYKVNEIQGWKYSHLASKDRIYEYLYIYKNGKKIIKISQFYHANYSKLKNQIQQNFKNLGYEKFSFKDEFKEFFK